MSVSLLAVAALVAGVFFTRSRQAPTPAPEIEADRGVENAVQLEALRRAGI